MIVSQKNPETTLQKRDLEGGVKPSKLLRCPECGSKRIWKSGFRSTSIGQVQRYVCRGCNYRFSDSFSRKNQIKEVQRNNIRQISVSESEMKNLVKVIPEAKEALRESNTEGQIISFVWYLKKLGRSNSTIKTYTKRIRYLAKLCDINNPESVKLAIATQFKENSTKNLLCCAYDAYLKFMGGQWEKPDYKPEHKRVFIPTEEELQLAINCGHKENVIFSKFLYETGARKNEAQKLEWTDIDQERKKATIKASKLGNSRIVSISEDLVKLLFSLPKDNKKVFIQHSKRSTAFYNRMARLAKIQNKPRMLKIHLHTFRHCKALREYHKTKSILHVKKVLGHKSINTTMRYVELYEEIYGDLKPEDYVCEIATNIREAQKLIESGFEYVCEIDGEKLFRKVKT